MNFPIAWDGMPLAVSSHKGGFYEADILVDERHGFIHFIFYGA